MSKVSLSNPFTGKNERKGRGLLDRGLEAAKEAVIGRAWSPLIVVARTTIVNLMEKITHGQLRVLTPEGIYTFGRPETNAVDPFPGGSGPTGDELKAEIRVINDAFWVRMLFLSDLGFAEAYMAGDIVVDNLDNVFKMFILNRANLSDMSIVTAHLFTALNAMMNSRFVNSVANSLSNISGHYDISNKMFSAFLSADMTYSCAIWGKEEGGPDGDRHPERRIAGSESPEFEDDLQAAQMRKIRTIITKANISSTDRVLEIGSGWGSTAIEAVRLTGCQVDTITLSIEQKQLAEERIAAAGYSDRIRVHLMDYRHMPESWHHAFDRVISIEMIEAVGIEFLETYFRTVTWALKPDRGLGVFQFISLPEERFAKYSKGVDFIQKYIFPGGQLSSVSYLIEAAQKGSGGKLIPEDLINIGPHYSRTLREWRRRFEARFETEIVPALREAHPEIGGRTEIDVFKRKWYFYFTYCESGFDLRYIGDHIISFTVMGNTSIVPSP